MRRPTTSFLASNFLDSAFGHGADGRPLFMPFGLIGGQYAIPDMATAQRLRRGVARLLPLALLPMLCLLALFLPPVRNAYALPLLGAMAASFALFSITFFLWVRHATRGLQRVDRARQGIPALLDPDEALARRLLDRVRPPRTRSAEETLGLLAGFACQMLLRHRAEQAGTPAPLIEVATHDGRLRYFGDALNGLLAEYPGSLWAGVGDGKPQLLLGPLFREMTDACVGDDPDYAQMIALLQRHWTATALILRGQGVVIDRWPDLFARALQLAAQDSDDSSLKPALLFMRAAIAMSKMDPAEILVPDQPAGDPLRRSRPTSRTTP
ncbi:hypothetical protein PMI04_016460 [Sphingobium sp. AP49]|uniref:hypothetical protein n=1 Tax=Sphingobium sp. AP49 TaxID=1144307 RepID=UPI00026ECD9F|nr:hypothetical protein [Sphingobium sp. AP49]WHO38140.1 hypothetical protein PMI04_016460 [Sphingobium sp. AP49]